MIELRATGSQVVWWPWCKVWRPETYPVMLWNSSLLHCCIEAWSWGVGAPFAKPTLCLPQFSLRKHCQDTSSWRDTYPSLCSPWGCLTGCYSRMFKTILHWPWVDVPSSNQNHRVHSMCCLHMENKLPQTNKNTVTSEYFYIKIRFILTSLPLFTGVHKPNLKFPIR